MSSDGGGRCVRAVGAAARDAARVAAGGPAGGAAPRAVRGQPALLVPRPAHVLHCRAPAQVPRYSRLWMREAPRVMTPKTKIGSNFFKQLLLTARMFLRKSLDIIINLYCVPSSVNPARALQTIDSLK